MNPNNNPWALPGPPAQPQPSPWDNAALLAALLVYLGLVLLFFGAFAAITAVQARRRGYPFVPWLLAGMLGNPIFLLVMLGVMPDFRRRQLRQKETEDLKRRLARQPQQRRRPPRGEQAASPKAGRVRPDRAAIDRSIGDEVTRDVPPPVDRSLGDEETRM
jgi:hypothetical protein